MNRAKNQHDVRGHETKIMDGNTGGGLAHLLSDLVLVPAVRLLLFIIISPKNRTQKPQPKVAHQ